MIRTYGSGIGGTKLAWFLSNRFHVASSSSSSSSCGLCLEGSLRRQRPVVVLRVYGWKVGSVDVLGRARLSGFCHAFRRVSRKSLVFDGTPHRNVLLVYAVTDAAIKLNFL